MNREAVGPSANLRTPTSASIPELLNLRGREGLEMIKPNLPLSRYKTAPRRTASAGRSLRTCSLFWGPCPQLGQLSGPGLVGSMRSPRESGRQSGALLPHSARCLGTQGLWLLAPLQSLLPNHRPSGCCRRVSNHQFLGGQRPARPREMRPVQVLVAQNSWSLCKQPGKPQELGALTGHADLGLNLSHHSLASCCPFLGLFPRPSSGGMDRSHHAGRPELKM